MAGDWIKMAVDLPEKPEVWQIAGMVGIDADTVVGKLLKVWRWFDAHTETGNAAGVTYALVDHVTGVTGFGEAMALAGWLEQSGSILSLPHFDRHNGKTAKNRALTAKRVASHKHKSNDEGNAVSVTSALPREEKRREEEKQKQATAEIELTDIAIPLADGGDHIVTLAELAEYEQAYPAIDVPGELRKARAWCVANPGQRKSRRGVGRFVNSWLARTAERTKPAQSAPKPQRKELTL